jgi:hypothetical protein
MLSARCSLSRAGATTAEEEIWERVLKEGEEKVEGEPEKQQQQQQQQQAKASWSKTLAINVYAVTDSRRLR